MRIDNHGFRKSASDLFFSESKNIDGVDPPPAPTTISFWLPAQFRTFEVAGNTGPSDTPKQVWMLLFCRWMP
jgi:hypothetical protein